MRDRLTAWWRLASEPVDAAGLRAFRVGFGVLLSVALVRLHVTGWVDPLFREPQFRFEYSTFAFIPPLPASWLVAVLAVGAACAVGLGVGRGWTRRLLGLGFVVCFGWLKLFDVTNYLNHDYLAVIVAAMLALLPLDGPTVPRWVQWSFRAQVGLVYLHAGLAKVNTEWLLLGQPLEIWFAANRGHWLVGSLLSMPFAPIVASWAACLYDCTIVLWLSWRRTRPLAFVAVLIFHASTNALFDIGIFPVLMTLAASVFFDPSWPRRFSRRSRPTPPTAPSPLAPRWVLALAVGWLAFQALFPLRSHLHDGDVLWDEQGMRWSWKVMLREKNGAITYRIKAKGGVREWQVSPLEVLTPRQANEMSGQPDLIVQLGKAFGDRLAKRLGQPVEVYVDALVSLNGRPPARLFRPDVDLLTLDDSALPSALLPSPRAQVN